MFLMHHLPMLGERAAQCASTCTSLPITARQTPLAARGHRRQRQSALNAPSICFGAEQQPHTFRHRTTTPSAVAAPEVATTPSIKDEDVCILQFPPPKAGAFSTDRRKFVEEHRIRGYEVHPDQRATLVTIANLLQEIAGNHAVGMWGRADNGFANIPSMKDLIFVMTRLQIRMLSYPKWGDIVQVETYFTDEGRLAARRDWVIKCAATGEVLGAATSTWVTINLAMRKLAKLPEDLKAKFMKFSPKPPRHAIPAEETKQKLGDMDETTQITGPQQVARRSDMDMNGHINNVTYLALALETLPEDVYNNHRLYEVEVDFKAECKAGELIDSLCCPLPQPHSNNGHKLTHAFLHSIRRCDASGPQELVRCRTKWVAK